MAVAGKPGLLASACLLIEFDRLYVYAFADAGGGAQLAVAPPGIDEAALAADMVAALRAVSAAELSPDPTVPPVLALHVGIVRVRDEGFAGSAVDRVLSVVHGGGSRESADAAEQPSLLAAITEPLFADLLGEGWPADGWYWQSPADAWMKQYPKLSPN